MKYIAMLLLICTLAQADDVVYLNKGTPAPSDGFFLTPEKEKEIRLSNIKLKYSEQLNESLVKINDIQKNNLAITDQRVKLFQDQSDNLAKQLESARSTSFIEKTLYFALGAILTGGIAYGVSKSLR